MPRRELVIPPFGLDATLDLPERAIGVVLFAHGSGSSRLSPRNRLVSAALNDAGIATVLFDLLTEGESRDRRNVFDIPLLAQRLVLATRHVCILPELRDLPVGFFGASTGAAAALEAAAMLGAPISAVVSRGGRPDLAMDALPRVTAPTLLIVGGEDREVLMLNRRAHAALACEKRLEIVAGATHLFEEPGTLEQVIALARDWFRTHLAPPA